MQQSPVCVWGPNDWASYYSASQELDSKIEEILTSPCPFNKGKLVADTHFAFVGVPDINGAPLTVVKWLELHPADSQPRFYFNQNPWHAGQPYTDVATLEPRLYILLREIVPGSTSSKPEEQVVMLPPEYEIPSTIAEVTKNILVFRKTGKRCNGSRWAACSERTIKTNTAGASSVSCVGLFNEYGLVVDYWIGYRSYYVGVGASRILNLESLKA